MARLHVLARAPCPPRSEARQCLDKASRAGTRHDSGSTPLVGLAWVGWLASLADWPLPWMIGSCWAVIFWLRCNGDAHRPCLGGRQTGQWIVASAIGLLHFTGPCFRQVSSAIGGLSCWAPAFPTVMLLRYRYRGTQSSGVDRATALFLPGICQAAPSSMVGASDAA